AETAAKGRAPRRRPAPEAMSIRTRAAWAKPSAQALRGDGTASDRDCGLGDPAGAQGTVPGRGPAAHPLSRGADRGGDQLVVLSPAPAGDLCTLAAGDARRLPLLGQDAARDHARGAAARC